uniref:Predicted protein n=1 Tax=Hordeum vulgare subsp. vulgare TaxID=112509 RepID=F2D2Y4_HORVV|nr:predicted protein [Hordeum vulgare subsp. vulgare]
MDELDNFRSLPVFGQARYTTLTYKYDGLRFVADAVTSSIAWPSSKMKPYKPGASSSSHR